MVRLQLQRLSSASQPYGASDSGDSDRSGEEPSSRLDLKRASSILRGEEVRGYARHTTHRFMRASSWKGSAERHALCSGGTWTPVDRAVCTGQSHTKWPSFLRGSLYQVPPGDAHEPLLEMTATFE